MTFLGLDLAIWIVLVVYFVGMLLVGWWSKRQVRSREGYLLGDRQFGTSMMVMHAFGAGTNPGDTTGCISKSVSVGGAGIWISWMWMFGTPFYWLIAPIMRRMRCLTMTDYFEERFGRGAAVLYTIVAGVGMMIFFGGVLLATTRTVQGMMGKATTPDAEVRPAPPTTTPPPGGEGVVGKATTPDAEAGPAPPTTTPPPGGEGVVSKTGAEAWFFGILLVSTAVFVLYGYWGGIVAAIRTDMVQGLMIIVLSGLAIWPALKLSGVKTLGNMRDNLTQAKEKVNDAIVKAREQQAAGDIKGMLATLDAAKRYEPAGPIRKILTLWYDDKDGPTKLEANRKDAIATLKGAKDADYLSLFNPAQFNWRVVILLSITAPLTALALPHLMSVTSAGKTEWEGRMGFVGGNLLKRICTIGWSLLALCWLAHLIHEGKATVPDAAFGDAIRKLLPTLLQGLMLACVMAASMSSGDAVQVTVAGLFTQSIYRRYINPKADEQRLLHFTRIAGVAVIAISLVFAILMRHSLVKAILLYFNVLAAVGISTALGILWRRMNQTGVFCGTIAAMAVLIISRAVPGTPMVVKYGAFLAAGFICGIAGSLLSAPPDPQKIEKFFTKIYVPIGQEDKLTMSLDQVVPQDKRLLTAGGLFIVKPSRQSWVGFLITLGICIACVCAMLAILGF